MTGEYIMIGLTIVLILLLVIVKLFIAPNPVGLEISHITFNYKGTSYKGWAVYDTFRFKKSSIHRVPIPGMMTTVQAVFETEDEAKEFIKQYQSDGAFGCYEGPYVKLT